MARFTFPADFASERTNEPRVRKTAFADGGYEQRIRFGLNSDPKVFNLTFENRSDTERDQILAFFGSTGGSEAFDWSSPLVNRRNLLDQTEDLTSSVWTRTALQSVSPGYQGFSGAENAFALVPSTTNTFHQITRTVSVAQPQATTLSIYAKSQVSTALFMQQSEGGNSIRTSVSLVTGQFDSSSLGSAVLTSTAATRVGSSGWWRISISGFTGNASQKSLTFRISDQSFNYSFAGNGTSIYAYLMAPQLESGSLTDYQPIISEPRTEKWVCEKWNTRYTSCNNNTITATFRQVFDL